MPARIVQSGIHTIWFKYLCDYLKLPKKAAGDSYYYHPYSKAPILHCPSVTFKAGTGESIQYGINFMSLTNPPVAGLGYPYRPRPLHKITHPTERVMLCDTSPSAAAAGGSYKSDVTDIFEQHNGKFSNVLFVDCHVAPLNAFEVRTTDKWNEEPFNLYNKK